MTKPAQAKQSGGYDSVRTYAWPPLPPHEFEVVSVTSAIDAGLAKPYLIGWAAKVSAQKAVDDHAIVSAMIEKGNKNDAISHIKSARNGDMTSKAHRGTIVHSALEAYVAGKELRQEDILAALEEKRVPEKMWNSTGKMIEGVMNFLSDFEPEVYWSESTVYSRQHGYAGTADLICRFPVGGSRVPVVLDVKTSKDIYDEVALQLVGYAKADFVGLDDGTEAKLTPTGEPIEYGVVVRPMAGGKYAHAIFALGDPALYACFLGCVAVASNKWSLKPARRP